MSDERRSNVGGDKVDDRHRRHSKSHHSRERHNHEIDEQSDRKRHHRHRHKHPRRSLSPGEVPPPPRHRSRSLSPGEVPPPSKRHRSRHSERRPDIDIPPIEKDPSPPTVQPPHEQREVSAVSPSAADTSSEDEVFGPMPASTSQQEQRSRRALGRGEFGHDPKDIEKYEQMGFVMSGNRRKKKQPAAAMDEASKKAGYLLLKEEKQLRETELVARFKEMIENRKAGDMK